MHHHIINRRRPMATIIFYLIAIVAILLDASLAQMDISIPTEGTLNSNAVTGTEITMADCMNGLAALDFQLKDFDRYDQYFRDDSELTLPQAGMYKGTEHIEEYVRFASETSPYLSIDGTTHVKMMFQSVDPENGTCEFLAYRVGWFNTDPRYAREARVTLATMMKGTYSYHEHYLKKVGLFLTDEWLEYVFGTVLQTEQTKNFICDVSEQCNNTNVGMSREECLQELDELPLFSHDYHFDGKDYSCRALHATFALTNPGHCPHISFEPQEDPEGMIKCQQSYNIFPSDIFSEDDFKGFYTFLDSPESTIESHDGFKITYMPQQTDSSHLIWFGVVVPIILLCTVFLTMKLSNRRNAAQSTTEDETSEQSLFANKSRKLWILLAISVGTLVTAFGAAAIIVWIISRTYPEWEADSTYEETPRAAAYLPNVWGVSETSPQSLLTDEQFAVYTGFILWTITITAGFGLEVFVWYQFLQIWSKERETLWRFVQFIFPLLGVTAVGLALYHNFLALPTVILCLWKFGFPETLMFLYLGCFHPKSSPDNRLSDLLNGTGTILHHSAATFIICMLLVGVIPPSRFIVSPILILLLQHWVALLPYVNVALYAAIELVLEYFFQWIVIAEFAQIYHLHWSAAVAAIVMLAAHWMYIIAGFIPLIGPYLGCRHEQEVMSDGHEEGSDAHNNVLTRGITSMSGSVGGDIDPEDLSKYEERRRGTSLTNHHNPNQVVVPPTRGPSRRKSSMFFPTTNMATEVCAVRDFVELSEMLDSEEDGTTESSNEQCDE